MEDTKKELLLILLKLRKLDINQKQYIKGWLDAKLGTNKGAS